MDQIKNKNNKSNNGMNNLKYNDIEQCNLNHQQYEWERLFEPSYHSHMSNKRSFLTKKRLYNPNGIIRHLPNLVDIKEEVEEEEKEEKQIRIQQLEAINSPNKGNYEIDETKTSAAITTTATTTTTTDKVAPKQTNKRISFSSISSISSNTSPTLPKLENLLLHSCPDARYDQHQVIILPCPSQALVELQQQKENNATAVTTLNKNKDQQKKERLNILNKIHSIHEYEGDQKINKWGKNAEDKRKKEIQVMTIPISERSSTQRWHPLLRFIVPPSSPTPPPLNLNSQKIIMKEENEKKYHYQHQSFIYFLLGFLFPPIWIFWPYFMKRQYKKRNRSMTSTDFKWKTRSRFAFYFFLIFSLFLFILSLVLFPQFLGYRNTSSSSTTNTNTRL